METRLSISGRARPRLSFIEGVEEGVSLLAGALAALFLAVLGGIVHWLRRIRRKNWWTFLAAVLTAAFSGVLSNMLTSWMEFDIRLQMAAARAAGYSGGAMLDKLIPLLAGIIQTRAGGQKEPPD